MNQRKLTDYLVVHAAATRPEMDIGVKDIRKWHMAKGWSDIGYHRVIRRDGTVENGRDINLVGAHVQGHNSRSIGICLAGGLDSNAQPVDNFTDKQKASLFYLLTELKSQHPSAKIVGHRDLSPDLDGDGVIEKHEWLKSCPCFNVPKWWDVCHDNS